MMLEVLLVPLDGSHLAESALDHAARLVKPDGTLVLLTVLQTPEYPIYDFYPMTTTAAQKYDKSLSDALPRAKEYLASVAERLTKAAPLRVRFYAEIGDPAETIVKTAEQQGAQAICMSTHGRSGFSRWLFGSVTAKVLASGYCPVYVVPTQQMEKRKTAELSAAKNGK